MLNEGFAQAMGHRIKEARLDRDINQTVLGKSMSVSQSSVGYWETGKRGVPLDKIPALCKALRITPGYLFGAEPIDAPQRVSAEMNRLRILYQVASDRVDDLIRERDEE